MTESDAFHPTLEYDRGWWAVVWRGDGVYDRWFCFTRWGAKLCGWHMSRRLRRLAAEGMLTR